MATEISYNLKDIGSVTNLWSVINYLGIMVKSDPHLIESMNRKEVTKRNG
jgi:hypothetical protein